MRRNGKQKARSPTVEEVARAIGWTPQALRVVIAKEQPEWAVCIKNGRLKKNNTYKFIPKPFEEAFGISLDQIGS